jgi:hypothetical protein
MQEERRATNRWGINAHCEAKFGGDDSFTSCRLTDINLKGVQIASPRRLPKDTFLNLSLWCHLGCMLDVEVWVVWERSVAGEHHYGFYFTKIADGDRQKIYKFMCESYPKLMVQCWWKGLPEEKGEETMVDNRIFERIPVKFPLRFLEPGSGQEGEGQTQDISAKGMGITTRAGLARKTSLEVWVEFPGQAGEPHYARGEVVWSQMVAPDEYRVGVNLEKADLMGLSRFMRT